ncbi:hypothetical protein OV203_13045 [Nannocystis sp. ILAH1]|uniref:hypothetical protein n=1 Tax=unclassified Nannocystis TaxID=2627009 RepID=UPI0022709EB4|nr:MULTISPECIES: hypothetical protein [unclassified Nannocystis]MCY0988057.1 hypothetical protein [Nannocystis sp. ILAH1]MCY1065561.1 hypothetical protein [Nannocystis sp. RBIL2]
MEKLPARSFVALSLLAFACREPTAGTDSGGAMNTTTDTGTSTEPSVPTGPTDTTSESTDTEGTWRRICDGSDALRLTLRTVGGELVHTELLRELGWSYLYVRGDCRYWVMGDDQSNLQYWRVTHTGTLSAEQEEELSRAVNYDRWAELAGHYFVPESENSPGYEIQYSDGVSTIRCAEMCPPAADAPDVLKDMTKPAREWIPRLWKEGESMEPGAPLRVDVLRLPSSQPLDEDECALAWTFALDPKSISRGNDDPPGSVAIADGDTTSKLRSLREQYLAGDVSPGMCNPVLLDGPFRFYEPADVLTGFSLWMRDAIPFETADGRVEIPSVPL